MGATLASASPAVTGDWKAQRDNCEGRGGTRCQRRCQRCPRARGSLGASFPLFSTLEQSRSFPCGQTRGVCHFFVPPSPATLLHQNIPAASDGPCASHVLPSGTS